MKTAVSIFLLATFSISAAASAIWHVDGGTGNDAADGLSWGAARKTIQSAINSAQDGDEILVADGTYSPITVANKAICIRSVNGSAHTTINGGGSARCAKLGGSQGERNTRLIGFTVKNGSGNPGGGVYCGTIEDCIVQSCSGGGIAYAKAIRCEIKDNGITSSAGYSVLSGGGALYSDLECCIVKNNYLKNRTEAGVNCARGAGLYGGSAVNCLIVGNTINRGHNGLSNVSYRTACGAGACDATLRNCTIVKNQVEWYQTDYSTHGGVGSSGCNSKNCIEYNNSWSTTSHYGPVTVNALSYNPKLTSEYYLSDTSPCINAGNDAEVVGNSDLAGNPRIIGASVDLGCYEYVFIPDVPEGVSASDGTADQGVVLSWNPAAYALAYNIWRSQSNDSSEAVQIACATETEFTDGSAMGGIQYWYWIQSVCATKTSELSSPDAGFAAAPSYVVHCLTPYATGGGADWHLASAGDEGGNNGITSGMIPDETNSWISTTLSGPGVLSFDWSVSCENRFAYLQFLMDGVQKKRITGTRSWENLVYEIGAGEHAVVWNYVKAGAGPVGDDAGFVRKISWRPYLSLSSHSEFGTPMPNDVENALYGETFIATIESTVVDGGRRYECVGWTGTGSVPPEGVTNACSFVLQEDSSIVWNWNTNYWTSICVEGPASIDFADCWLESGTNLSIAIVQTVPWCGIRLSGDTAGATLSGTNLTFCADRPRDLLLTVVELTYENSLETTNLVWKSGGDADWVPQIDMTYDGVDAVKSGAVVGKGVSYLETVVIGPGTLTFPWKLDVGGANAGVDLLIDGEFAEGLSENTDWVPVTIDLEEGRHVVRWEYWCSSGPDAGKAFLDSVVWTGSYPVPSKTTVTVSGPAFSDFTEGWLSDGSNMVVHIIPTVPFFNIVVSGDVAGVTLDGTTLFFEVTGPRDIRVLVEPITFADALDNAALKWKTDGAATWIPYADSSYDGFDAARSGFVTNKNTSALETTVDGPGTLSFHWRFDSLGTRSGVDLMVDGDYYDGLDDDADWSGYSMSLGPGRHVVRWEHWSLDNERSGVVYLDDVSWTGLFPTETMTTPVAVPYAWIDDCGLSGEGYVDSYETAAHGTAANGMNKVWECYVAGISPIDDTAVFQTRIDWVDGKPVVSPDPDLNQGLVMPIREYRLYGKKALDFAEDWTDITELSNPDVVGYRFFKMSVQMKEGGKD